MSYQRRRRGFERVGRIPLDRLGLSKSRVRELLVARAWSRVAGRAIMARTRAVNVRRGLLEIEIEDGPWASTLAELLPRLAGRIGADHPELAVRKCRLARPGPAADEPVRSVVPPDDAVPAANDEPEPTPKVTQVPDRPIEERLSELADVYLARFEK